MVNGASSALADAPGALWPRLCRLVRGKRTLPLLLLGSGFASILIGNQRESAALEEAQALYPLISTPEFAPQAKAIVGGLVSPPATTAPPIGPAADIARVINASTPFAPQAAVPSLPLLATGDSTDQERATDCLAAAGYYEAGIKAGDQRAVMQVVLNRVRHSAFPNSICGVVFQGSERRTGCQFTFTCDGAMSRRQPSAVAWRQARMVALEMLTGRVEPAVGHATHYHTNWVHPAWSAQMQKIAAVDTHLFFRWSGRPGEAKAFTARYSGVEPHIPRMAWLSLAQRVERPQTNVPPANAVQTALPDAPLLGKLENRLIALREPLPDQARAPDPDVILVTLDPTADPDSFVHLAQQSCAGKATCRFLGWTDTVRKAKMLPVSGAAIDAISFSYIRHGADDSGNARWNCTEFPRDNQAQCLRRGS